MAAIWLTARAEWRQRWRSFVVLAVLAGLAGGVALAAFTGSRRADTAFAACDTTAVLWVVWLYRWAAAHHRALAGAHRCRRGLVVGLPAGVIAGRRIWSALAPAIGVVDDWSFPWLSAILAAAVAVVNRRPHPWTGSQHPRRFAGLPHCPEARVVTPMSASAEILPWE
jgi:hypothetical protein